MRRVTRQMLTGVVLAMGVSGAWATDAPEDVKSEHARPVIRGGIVYKSYCVLCHGATANGDAKAAKLYDVATLAIKPMPTEYYESIIRKGGAAVGKSPFMPPWQEELSDEQVRDVISYLGVARDAVGRGEVVFKTNCVLCHGVKGDGKGRASVLFNPPPANLTRSDKNDEYKTMIITMGGAAMGRSPVMPVWGEQLSTQEINDAVVYLRTILVK
ncbi:MAG: c-type cytochrome [Gammaproteobacteria bacterium]